MPTAAVLAPLMLTAVLLLSAVTKARDPESTRSVVQQLRLPRMLHGRWLGEVLPAGEFAVAILLLAPWRPLFLAAAIASLALCLGYWAVIARAMTFQPRPTCGCFGRIGDQQVSGRTLTRNTLLVAAGAVSVALGATGSTAVTLLRGDVWWWIVAAAGVAAVAVLIGAHPAGTASVTTGAQGSAQRSAARSARRSARGAVRRAVIVPSPVEPAAPGVGPTDEATSEPATAVPDDLDYLRTDIPPATLLQPDGTVVTLQELAAKQPQLLVAVDCTCGSTYRTVAALAGWREQLPVVQVRLVTTLRREVLAGVDQAAAEDALYDHAAVVWDALHLGNSPAAVLLGADGLLAGGPVSGVDAVDEFVADIAAELADRPG